MKISARNADGTIAAVPLVDRFWPKVNREGPLDPRMDSCCWEWKGMRFRNGYGGILSTHVNGKHRTLLAHRVSYEMSNGPIPEGLCVLHVCDNRKCVRPDHLFLGTAADNIHDMIAKGRAAVVDGARYRGELNPSAKLTEEQVRVMRSEYVPRVVTRSHLADKFGVSLPLVDKILGGRVWKHIGGAR